MFLKFVTLSAIFSLSFVVGQSPPRSQSSFVEGRIEEKCEGLGSIVRKEMKSVTQKEWDDYVDAFDLLCEKPSKTRPGLSVYEQFSADHQEFSEHSNSLFLAWHRVFLWEFDKALHSVKPVVVQPWFEWTLGAGDIFKDDAFGPSRFGGRRRGTPKPGAANPAPIPNGSFRGLNSSWTLEHLVIRNFTYHFPLKDEEFVHALVEETNRFTPFSTTLEHGVHDEFHGAIGGDMNNLSRSPNSPLFYVHHAFIDEIYGRWLDRKIDTNRKRDLDAVLRPWNVTMGDVLFGITNCVTYERREKRSVVRTLAVLEETEDSVVYQNCSDKIKAMRLVAKRKEENPGAYQKELKYWDEEERNCKTISLGLGASPERVAAAQRTAKTLLLRKKMIDIEEADDVLSKSEKEVAAEGHEERAVLGRNEIPNGKERIRADVLNDEL